MFSLLWMFSLPASSAQSMHFFSARKLSTDILVLYCSYRIRGFFSRCKLFRFRQPLKTWKWFIAWIPLYARLDASHWFSHVQTLEPGAPAGPACVRLADPRRYWDLLCLCCQFSAMFSGKFGVAKSLLFPFQVSTWWPRHSRDPDVTSGSSAVEVQSLDMFERYFIHFAIFLWHSGTVQRDFNSVFLTYMDMPRHEYEPLQILKFCKGPRNFRSEMAFFAWLWEIISEWLYFSELFFKMAETILK
jgi:hypothetical protein